jgi:hypothetical protein
MALLWFGGWVALSDQKIILHYLIHYLDSKLKKKGFFKNILFLWPTVKLLNLSNIMLL